MEKTTPVFTLNEGQQYAKEWLVDFCMGKQNYRKVLLEGYAGTGKTFTINRVVENMLQLVRGISFGMTAPTHKAVRVLKKASELKHKLEFGTIHSFLALKQTVDEHGTVHYKPDFNPNQGRKIDGIDVLIIDESSMLDDELFGYIEDEVRNSNLLVIFMGDPLQIPPVGKKQTTGEAFAIPFIKERQQSHKIAKLSLTEPQRQAADSPIIMYAHNLRAYHTKSVPPWDFLPEHKHALENISLSAGTNGNIERIREVLREYFCTEEFKQDADYAKVVAWRNNTVDYFNKEIRLMINNATSLPKIICGDKLVMDAPIVSGSTVIVSNNEEVVPVKVEVVEIDVPYKGLPDGTSFMSSFDENIELEVKKLRTKVYQVDLVRDDTRVFSAFILHEDSEQMYKEHREKMSTAAKRCRNIGTRKKLWKAYYEIQDNLAWVKYNYALTSHKAQGSTYQFCISMEWDINQNRDVEERNRIKYVAVTRAKQKAFIVTN